MAFTFDVSTWSGLSNANPRTLSHTCGSGTTVFVLGISIGGTTARTGGSPTFGGIQMTKVNSYSSGETGNELWYHLNPSTGTSYTISVPNSGNLNIALVGSSYKTAPGFFAELNSSSIQYGIVANPSTNITTYTDNCLIVQNWTSGLNSLGNVGTPTGVKIVKVDLGTYGIASQYYLAGSAGTYKIGWTGVSSEDYILINAAFKEYKPYGGILKYYNGSSWVECPSSNLKIYLNSIWQILPQDKFKIYRSDKTPSGWYPIRYNG